MASSAAAFEPSGVGENALTASGEMGARIASFDWSSTPLGPISGWPASLRAITNFVLNSPVPMVMLWGEDGIMLYNDGYAVFAGDRHPQLLGSKVREGWPEVADFNDNIMKVGLAGGTLAYKNHVLSLNRTGTFEDVWLDLDYSPVFDDAGRPAGVLAIVIETTDAVTAAANLRQSEARLRFLDELGQATAASVSADEVLAITTRMVGETLGVAMCAYADLDADQEGFTIRGDWTRGDLPSIVGHYRLADLGDLAVERLHAGQPLIICDNRRELTTSAAAAFQAIGIAASICMPLVKEGRLTALMAIHQDRPHDWVADELATLRAVTERSWAHIERVAAETELRHTADRLRELNETLEVRVEERSAALDRSQTQFRLLVQGVSDYAIYMLDPSGLVSSWNAGAERIKGFAPEEVIGRHFRTFYPEEDRDRGLPEQALETALREGRFASEGLRVRKDGTHFRASVVIDAIKDDDGALIGYAKITRDVTERDEAQRELELAREALFQSQKLEAIGQLTGGVAHDFNNLLMAIMSGLELLRKRVPDDPRIVKLLDNATQAADRGAKLTQRMLAFARRQELTAEPVNLPKLVAGMTELMQRSLGPQYVIDTSFSAGLPPALTDVNQLEMALLNLAVNARDAMPDGGRLTISATDVRAREGEVEDLAPGRYLRLTIADNGSGMDADTLRRAADPFFTTKGVGKGTGLGLSMVHGFTRQMGGALQLDSSPGEGTRAHIWLPAAAGATLLQMVPAEAAAESAGPPRTILAVDDDGLVLMNTVAMLEDLGHRVFEAASGEEALAAFDEHDEIDLLVTDQAMPGMTGSALIAALRRRRADLPVILATGYGETPADVGAAVHRLSKPYGQAELARALTVAMPD